jgi:cytochrome b
MIKQQSVRVRVWDVPTRLFHWTLVVLFGFSWFSGEQGNEWLRWHFLSGYAILTLVLFRISWGVLGSTYSRFRHFVRGPRAVVHHLRSLVGAAEEGDYGHNPAGAWMIVAMLVLLLIQAGTGLFADDDIFTQGPLGDLVSADTRHWFTMIHSVNVSVILVLVGLHIAAMLVYLALRRENLIATMVTGYKAMARPDPTGPRFVHPGLAVLLLAVAGLAVWGIVRIGG